MCIFLLNRIKQESKKARKQESKKARKQESKKARKQENKKTNKKLNYNILIIQSSIKYNTK
jgi:hypothetical protein